MARETHCPHRFQRIFRSATASARAYRTTGSRQFHCRPKWQPKWRAQVMNKPDFANISNADYVDSLYRQYQADPRSVSDDWRIFFAGFDLAGGRAAAPAAVAAAGAASAAAASPPVPISRAEIAEEARKGSRRGAAGATASVLDIIHSYRE